MIKEKTVFVFGAGLSSDYGFPIGTKLRNDIVKYIDGSNGNSGSQAQIERLIKMGFEKREIISAREAISTGGFDTIDEFMRTRPEFRPLTKTLIASIIIKCENPNISFGRNSTNCFYRFIFNKMIEGVTLETFADNNVSFVTFNYDRSFEFFIWRALCGRFGLDKKLAQIMNKIKIIHVHGKIGKLPWDTGEGIYRDYQSVIEYGDNFKSICDGIVSFGEVDDSHAEYIEAREEIKNAENLFFVGFGFHKTDTKRLLDGIAFDNKKIVSGTSCGKNDQDLKNIDNFTNGKLNSKKLIHCNAVEFANQYLIDKI